MGDITLPTRYTELAIYERRIVREKYIELQGGNCYYCGESLNEKAPKRITDKKIRWDKFPKNFLQYPIHLQHNHDTDLTEGAVHNYCNAMMWQYENK